MGPEAGERLGPRLGGPRGPRAWPWGRWCLGHSSEGRGTSGGRQLGTALPGTCPQHSRNKLWEAQLGMFSEQHALALTVCPVSLREGSAPTARALKSVHVRFSPPLPFTPPHPRPEASPVTSKAGY